MSYLRYLIAVVGLAGIGVVTAGCGSGTATVHRIDIENVFGEPDVFVQRYGNREVIRRKSGRTTRSRFEAVDGGGAFPYHEEIWVYGDRGLRVAARDGRDDAVGPLDDEARELLTDAAANAMLDDSERGGAYDMP